MGKIDWLMDNTLMIFSCYVYISGCIYIFSFDYLAESESLCSHVNTEQPLTHLTEEKSLMGADSEGQTAETTWQYLKHDALIVTCSIKHQQDKPFHIFKMSTQIFHISSQSQLIGNYFYVFQMKVSYVQ